MMRDALVAAGLVVNATGSAGSRRSPLRGRAAVALALVLAVANVAEAAPKRVCHLLRGGLSGGLQEHNPDEPVLITSADIANNRTHLTAAIRVRSMADPQEAVSGRRFSFQFQTNPEFTWLLEARVFGGKTEAIVLWREPVFEDESGVYTRTEVGTGTAVIDGKELRITVPLSLASLSAKKRPATRLTNLRARVERMYGTSRSALPSAVPFTSVAPVGTEYSVSGRDAVYVLNTPTCVAVGR